MPSAGRALEFNEGPLKAFLEEDSHQKNGELTEKMRCGYVTVPNRLRSIEFSDKFQTWLTHVFSEENIGAFKWPLNILLIIELRGYKQGSSTNT